MSRLKKLRLIARQSVFGSITDSKRAESVKRAWPDPITVAQWRLIELKSDLGLTAADEHWAAFSNTVLVQMERVAAARGAAESVPLTDPAHAERKRELIRQVIATPVLLSRAAQDLYTALTPEQQRTAGEKLRNFHRQLIA
jgi:hypothetical protein